MRTRTLRSWETRRFDGWITANTDPTGDTVEFAAVDIDAVDEDPGAWTAGTWTGTYNTATGRVASLSPTFGTSESTVAPDVTLTEGTTYYVYSRVRNATDAPGELVAVLVVS